MAIAAYDDQGNFLGLKRLLTEIFQSIQALSAGQRANLWNDLRAPVSNAPRKYLADDGTNAGAIFSMDYQANQSVSPPTTAAQNSIMSCYIQDNPLYAVNPPFDPAINIPGFTPPA